MKQKIAEINHAAKPGLQTHKDGSGLSSAQDQAIRERAFEIHSSHDDPNRNPTLDWLEAEQQIRTAAPQAWTISRP